MAANVTFKGEDHLILNVVMIVEGVLNNALLPKNEFCKYVKAWDNRPVVIYHPMENGEHVSANSPDIIEKVQVGYLFNTRCETNKLVSEAWININKLDQLDYNNLLEQDQIEVSVGYYADGEVANGIFNNERYSEIHRNLRPDHLAILPDQIGACSIADGCGIYINWEYNPMSDELLTKAEELEVNKMITPKQLKMLQDMDAEQLEMISTIAKQMATGNMGEEPEETQEPEERMEKDKDPDVRSMVKEAIRREKVAEKLRANSSNPLNEEDLNTLPVDHLEDFERKIRQVDYSGVSYGPITNQVEPLMPNSLVTKRG